MSERVSDPLAVPLAFQAIQRLCRLQSRVSSEVFQYDHASDCFCGQGGAWPLERAEDYRNEFVAIDFIEEAVEIAILRHRNERSERHAGR